LSSWITVWAHSADYLLIKGGGEVMNEIVANGPWIVAQLVRIRTLEAEVRKLLITSKSSAVLQGRVMELNRQLTLLDLAIN
jgi:hypothetical protein